MTFSKLRGLIDNSQTALKQWQANAQSLNEFIRTMALQKNTIANTTEMLRSQIDALAKTSKQIISETQDFRTKLKKYAPSDTEKAIQSYEKKLSASSKKIESDADKIYNLNFNLEKELRKLIVESENLNKMLRSHQNQLKKTTKQ